MRWRSRCILSNWIDISYIWDYPRGWDHGERDLRDEILSICRSQRALQSVLVFKKFLAYVAIKCWVEKFSSISKVNTLVKHPAMKVPRGNIAQSIRFQFVTLAVFSISVCYLKCRNRNRRLKWNINDYMRGIAVYRAFFYQDFFTYVRLIVRVSRF